MRAWTILGWLLAPVRAGFRMAGYNGVTCGEATLSWSDSGITGLANPLEEVDGTCIDFYIDGKPMSMQLECSSDGDNVYYKTFTSADCDEDQRKSDSIFEDGECRKFAEGWFLWYADYSIKLECVDDCDIDTALCTDEIDAGPPVIAEVQTVTISADDAMGGTFALSFEGKTTAAIDHNWSADNFAAELKELPVDVGVMRGPETNNGYSWIIAFDGVANVGDLPMMTCDARKLTGTNAKCVVVETTKGEIATPSRPPTYAPTTAAPTYVPTSAGPSTKPSPEPTSKPSSSTPSSRPTPRPSSRPTPKPSETPTPVPSKIPYDDDDDAIVVVVPIFAVAAVTLTLVFIGCVCGRRAMKKKPASPTQRTAVPVFSTENWDGESKEEPEMATVILIDDEDPGRRKAALESPAPPPPPAPPTPPLVDLETLTSTPAASAPTGLVARARRATQQGLGTISEAFLTQSEANAGSPPPTGIVARARRATQQGLQAVSEAFQQDAAAPAARTGDIQLGTISQTTDLLSGDAVASADITDIVVEDGVVRAEAIAAIPEDAPLEFNSSPMRVQAMRCADGGYSDDKGAVASPEIFL